MYFGGYDMIWIYRKKGSSSVIILSRAEKIYKVERLKMQITKHQLMI